MKLIDFLSLDMYNVFQADLFKLRLNAARSFAKTLETSLNPVSSSLDDPVKLSAQVISEWILLSWGEGIGPLLYLKVPCCYACLPNHLL